MIRLSAGTAACLKLSHNRMDASPTTAYLLSGEHCVMNCAFCPQGNSDNNSLSRLGRISWPTYEWSNVEDKLACAYKHEIRRICLQSVRYREGVNPLLDTIKKLKSLTSLPLSLSAWIRSEDEAALLFQSGVERVSISLDVANPDVFQKIKGGSLGERLDLLLRCAGMFPGRMTTHLICGLGETELEMITLIDRLVKNKITVALFAFVPLRGTALAGMQPPRVDSYRRIQAASYLLRCKTGSFPSFIFDEQGILKSYGIPKSILRNNLDSAKAFRTSGCPDCNRPYYNERPGGTIYNYPRELNRTEAEAEIELLLKSIE